jgi:hypothetical protein
MQTKIHICFSTSNPDDVFIIPAHELRKNKNAQLNDGYILKRQYSDTGEEYWHENISVIIKKSFLVITHGKFVRDENQSDELNAVTYSHGFRAIDSLVYSYSAIVVDPSLINLDPFWTSSGIRTTQHNMYSYHLNSTYCEDRLDWEVFDSLDFWEILAPWLPKSKLRDKKIDQIIDN